MKKLIFINLWLLVNNTIFASDNLDNIKNAQIEKRMALAIHSEDFLTALNNTNFTQRTSPRLKNPLSPNSSFVNLSTLNDKPAGNHGFVKTVNDGFKFEDGTTARFFGTNIQAYSLFINNKSLIKLQAERISRLGFNLVRLHHHDSIWLKNNLIRNGDTTQEFNEKALDNYFWWVKCLRDEGIYVWVDLQVQRPWRKGDAIPGWETDMALKAKNGMSVSKGFIYLNNRMQELTKKFNEKLLTRINPYTQLPLKDDPAVMGVMITNENDITQHFGNVFLKNKKHIYHQSQFKQEAINFSKKFKIDLSKVMETWKAGPSKFLLNDIEARFNQDMISHLRGIGLKVPIATTSLWGKKSALFSLPALTIGNMIDAHGYSIEGKSESNMLTKNPRYVSNFLHRIGQGQVMNKPFTVSEYNGDNNSGIDNSYISAISMASMAAFQGWDAIMLYGYSQDGFKGGKTSLWSSYMHPSIMGVIPAMAVLFREQHVSTANKTVILSPAVDELFTKTLSAETSVTLRSILERHRMVVAMPKNKMLPWLSPSEIPENSVVIKDLNKDILPSNQNYVISDTGELKRNWHKGTMIINTSKSQLVMGKIGDHLFKLKDITVKSITPEAAIIFTSLDKEPLKSSSRILVSAVAKVEKAKFKNITSYMSEPVEALITFSSIHKGLRLQTLLADGKVGRVLPLISHNKDEYIFKISEKDNTHWYIITQ